MSRQPHPRSGNPGGDDVPGSHLRLRSAAEGDQALLHVVGEIDQDNAPELRDALVALVGGGAARVFVDLEGVTFCDSTGLHALLHARTQALAAGVDLTLAPGPAVLRLLEITETAPLFVLHTVPAPAPSATPRPPVPGPPTRTPTPEDGY